MRPAQKGQRSVSNGFDRYVGVSGPAVRDTNGDFTPRAGASHAAPRSAVLPEALAYSSAGL